MFQSVVIHADFESTNHSAVINAVCYNRHQDCFVSADDTRMRLWSPTAGASGDANGGGAGVGGRERRQIRLPARTTNFIQALEYIESRQLYVAATLDGTLKAYDLNMTELASVSTGRGTILSMVFDATHNRLLTGGVGGCTAWLVCGKPLGSGATGHGMNPHYELSPLPNFSHRPATDSRPHDDPHVRVTGAGGGSSKSGSEMPARGAAKHNGARLKATAKTLESHQRPWVQRAQLNSDKTKLYAQSRHCVDVFSAMDGRFIETYADLFPKEHGAIMAFVVHERTQYVVCGCINGWIFVVSLHPSSVLHVFKGHTLSIASLAVRASSNLILSSSLDGAVRLWDLEARRQAHRLDIGQPVQGLQLLAPNTKPCRFLCRVRSRIQLFRVQSTIKEHLPVLSPVRVLQRVLYPTHHGDANRKTRSTIDVRGRYDYDDKDEDLSSEDGDESDGDAASEPLQTQVIVAAGMDKTIRLFAGHTANEAPSFTWIPEETSLDLISFALNPCGKHLFLLLESQRIVIVDVESNQAHEKSKEGTLSSDRVVDMSVSPPAFDSSSAAQRQASGQTSSIRDTLNSAASRKKSRGIGSTGNVTSNTHGNGNWGGVRGSIRCICACYYPPIFRSAVPSAAATASVTPAAQSKWLSRTFVSRRQPSSIAFELKKAEEEFAHESSNSSSYQQHAHRRNALIQSEYEWIVCGSEFGHLVFWHTGPANNGKEAVSIDAHDAAIISMATNSSSSSLVTLDDAKRVNFWHLQPVFMLCHMLDLSEKPSCFVLSPESKLSLPGYGDGNVLLMDVSDPSALETYSNDENHFAMVSAADFLDEKGIVLTASVGAMIKIWDQQKALLRQIHIAVASASLCFMNASGDLMAGLSNGIFIVTKDDALPEKVPKHPRKNKNKETTAATAAASAASRSQKEDLIRPGVLVEARTNTQNGDLSDHNATAGRIDIRSNSKRPLAEGKLLCAAQTRGQPTASLSPISGDAKEETPAAKVWQKPPHDDLTQWLTYVDRPVAVQHAPVLRPVTDSRKMLPATTRADHVSDLQGVYQPKTPMRRQRPKESCPQTLLAVSIGGKEEDWREQLTPSTPYRLLSAASGGTAGHWHSRRKAQAPSPPVVLQTLTQSPRTNRDRIQHHQVNENDNAAAGDGNSSTNPSGLEPRGLGIGSHGAISPLQYCKHQAPVPPKEKTPRKLWNAIGGEDRRFIVLQRNNVSQPF